MKKLFSLQLMLVLILLCGCAENRENTDTRLILDTVASLTADCNDKILEKAFKLCEEYEKLFSPREEKSGVYRLNSKNTPVTVSEETITVINHTLYYSELSKDMVDITAYPISKLWDFKAQAVPERKEIAEAFKNVDYQSLTI